LALPRKESPVIDANRAIEDFWVGHVLLTARLAEARGEKEFAVALRKACQDFRAKKVNESGHNILKTKGLVPGSKVRNTSVGYLATVKSVHPKTGRVAVELGEQENARHRVVSIRNLEPVHSTDL
jgi:hypothetical protein